MLRERNKESIIINLINRGILHFADGSKYEGEFMGNDIHGHGKNK